MDVIKLRMWKTRARQLCLRLRLAEQQTTKLTEQLYSNQLATLRFFCFSWAANQIPRPQLRRSGAQSHTVNQLVFCDNTRLWVLRVRLIRICYVLVLSQPVDNTRFLCTHAEGCENAMRHNLYNRNPFKINVKLRN